jgi:hypothetical protein
MVYPSDQDYSPSERYPEYPFGDISMGENRVYGLVRNCLHDFGADAEHFGTDTWNPLGEWIELGQRVFVLPNLVMHRRPGETLEKFYAKCTHGSVLRPVLDYATIACGDPNLVAFGNAPLQSCDYARVTRETGVSAVAEFYRREAKTNIGPVDLRLLVARWTTFGALLQRELRDETFGVPVDLGANSWLDELFQSGDEPQVRVGDYAPTETMSYHGRGRHIYVVNRRLLEADVIISVPKLKTHQKVGITCALKGTVGAIGRKECLAHHRRGAPENGGDEYPRSNPARDLASRLADQAAAGETDLWSNAVRVQSKVLERALRSGKNGIMGGAWYGNDTAWRMALDIARILRYARSDGSLSPTPLRQ